MEQEHKRRVRYKGTHPRSYKEKYKELQPEKYQADVEKIIRSGKTPAGMHISIMVDEILEFLQIQPGQTGLDATLGYGGHTRRMLEKLQGQGHMYATDVDPIESEKTRKRLEEAGFGPEILTIRRMNFADLDQVAPGEKFDFILADLGVSSMQIDNPERGFTFKYDGPLDLRLDPTGGVTAAQRLREHRFIHQRAARRLDAQERHIQRLLPGFLISEAQARRRITADLLHGEIAYIRAARPFAGHQIVNRHIKRLIAQKLHIRAAAELIGLDKISVIKRNILHHLRILRQMNQQHRPIAKRSGRQQQRQSQQRKKCFFHDDSSLFFLLYILTMIQSFVCRIDDK